MVKKKIDLPKASAKNKKCIAGSARLLQKLHDKLQRKQRTADFFIRRYALSKPFAASHTFLQRGLCFAKGTKMQKFAQHMV